VSKKSQRGRNRQSSVLNVGQGAQAGAVQPVFVATAASFSGPLPPPSILKQYDDIVPGGAARIVEMAEKQAEHRRTLESVVVTGDDRRAWSGLRAGFFVTLFAIACGTAVALLGQPWAGATIAGVPTAGLVSVFVIGSSERSKERKKKAQLITAGQRQQV
jgi:uncharacterized membrane protein